MNLESKNLFEKASRNYGLSPAEKAKGWQYISDLQLAPDEPMILFMVVGLKFGFKIDQLLDALRDFTQFQQESMRNSVAGKALHCREVNEQAKTETTKQRTSEPDPWANAVGKVAVVRTEILLPVACFLTLTVLVMGATIGYSIGRSETEIVAEQFRQASSSPSAADWSRLAVLNPNFSLDDLCSPLTGATFEAMEGGTGCKVSVFTSTQNPPSSAIGRMWALVADFSRRGLPWYVLLIVIGLAGMKHFRKNDRWKAHSSE